MKRTRPVSYVDGAVRRVPEREPGGSDPQRSAETPRSAEPIRSESRRAEPMRSESRRAEPRRSAQPRRKAPELRLEPQPAPLEAEPTPLLPAEPPPLRQAGQESLHSAVRRIGHKSTGRHVHRGIGAKLSDGVSRLIRGLFGSR